MKPLSSLLYSLVFDVFFRMKVHGELPLLSLHISDNKLQQVLSLVQSIPLPAGPPPEQKDEFSSVSPLVNIDG